MDIIAQLIQFDKELLILINGFHTPYFDVFMYTFSKVGVWIPFYASVLYILFKKVGIKAIWLTLLLILGVVLCDQLTVLMKESIQRFRPSHDPNLEYIIHLVKNKRAGLYGFVSSHAANTVGFALLSSLIIRRRNYSIAVFSWAAITCYSRMYLGMHFPFDIIGGAITGFLIAIVLYAIKKWYLNKHTRATYDNEMIPVYTLISTTLAIAIFSFFG